MADNTRSIPQFMLSGLKNPDGTPLSLGLVYHYKAGTTTQSDLATDLAGTAADQPIILDAAGFAQVYGLGLYKFVLCNSQGAVIQTIDAVRLGYDSAMGNASDLVPLFLNGIPDAKGQLLREGTVEMYEAGTNTPKSMDTADTPVNIGQVGPVSVQQAFGNFKFVIKDIQGNIVRTIDHLHLGAIVYEPM